MKKKKVGIIASSVAAIAVCSSMVVGSTFALFTSKDNVNIAVSSGKVEVVAKIVDIKELSSMGVQVTGDTWANGGTATFTNESELTVTNITPGDAVNFDIKIANNSTVIVKYRISYEITDKQGVNGNTGKLSDYLTVTAEDKVLDNWTEWGVPADESAKSKTVNVSVALPINADNEAQDSSANISFKVEAVQGNAQTYTKETEAIINAINQGATDSNNKLSALYKDKKEFIYFDKTLQLTDDGKAHMITLHADKGWDESENSADGSGVDFEVVVNTVLGLIGEAVLDNIGNINSIQIGNEIVEKDEDGANVTMAEIVDGDKNYSASLPITGLNSTSISGWVFEALKKLNIGDALTNGVDVTITDSKDTSHVYTMKFDISGYTTNN